MSPLPELDIVETRKASSRAKSVVSRKDEFVVFRDPTIPIEREMDLPLQVPTVPKQMDEFLSLVTGTESSELPERTSTVIPTVPSESEAPVSKRVSAEPSKIGDGLSDSIAAAPGELQKPSAKVKSATASAVHEGSGSLNATKTHVVGDAVAAVNVAELEKVFAKFSLPGRGEIYEARATTTTGHPVSWRQKAISIGRIEKYLALVALLLFVPSLLAYWIRPFEDASPDPEVTARDADASQSGFDMQAPVVEANPGTKPGNGVEWQSALQSGSGERSLNRGVRGPAVENSLPNSAASDPSRLAAMATTEPNQQGENPVPIGTRRKAERKKVTVDDLITDKKKVTVDDLINDN